MFLSVAMLASKLVIQWVYGDGSRCIFVICMTKVELNKKREKNSFSKCAVAKVISDL